MKLIDPSKEFFVIGTEVEPAKNLQLTQTISYLFDINILSRMNFSSAPSIKIIYSDPIQIIDTYDSNDHTIATQFEPFLDQIKTFPLYKKFSLNELIKNENIRPNTAD